MKKTSIKKLTLDRHTIRKLTDAEAARVVGGAAPGPTHGSRCICNVSETYCGRECMETNWPCPK